MPETNIYRIKGNNLSKQPQPIINTNTGGHPMINVRNLHNEID